MNPKYNAETERCLNDSSPLAFRLDIGDINPGFNVANIAVIITISYLVRIYIDYLYRILNIFSIIVIIIIIIIVSSSHSHSSVFSL